LHLHHHGCLHLHHQLVLLLGGELPSRVWDEFWALLHNGGLRLLLLWLLGRERVVKELRGLHFRLEVEKLVCCELITCQL
jgi:hypothetical protein